MAKKNIRRRASVFGIVMLAVSLALLLFNTRWDSIAYLVSRSISAENTFTPAQVTCRVEESFDGHVKRDVCVRNTGNTEAYIRAAIVINFVTADNKVYGKTPMAGVDYTISYGDGSWLKGSDGFWYYKYKVSPGEATDKLLQSVTDLQIAPEGCRLQVQIVASAIQAIPERAVIQSWGVDISNGTLRVE